MVVVYGTRPEAIKLAPVVRALRASAVLDPVVVVTGQHRQMLDQVNALFGISPEHDLDLIRPRQDLTDLTARALTGLAGVLAARAPTAVVVQGDTTTSTAAAFAAFHSRIPVVHVEAGLRSDDRANPFPEEINRRLTTQLTDLHLAPTPRAAANLTAERVPAERVLVTGNTVIDALRAVLALPDPAPVAEVDRLVAGGRRVVLVTTHRRESWGEPMRRTAAALARLAVRHPDVDFVVPAHLNPTVREVLLPPLSGFGNVVVLEPLPYAAFARLLAACHVVLTDSGGLQEEGPSLGKPVLVLRDVTERPEAVEAGTVRLVGTDTDRIVAEVSTLLDDHDAHAAMARAVNPYGDGHAAQRTVAAVEWFLGHGSRPDEFDPAPLGPAARAD